jgi:protein-S-isoprenylcysteine O-methyltransferase Ste14
MRVNLAEQAGEFLLFFVAFALALFLPAGNFGWLAGWIYFALFFSFYLGVNVWLYRHNPGLLQERAHLSTSDQKGWDKLLFPVLVLFPFLWLVFISLDAERFHWSPEPLWLQYVGGIILLGSFYVLFLAFRENSYLSPVVRIQEERGQQVVSTGPYRYVRHPMYAGILLFAVGTPLMLGSWAGVLVASVFVAILARRAVLEERTLRQELPGYEAYMERVRYRIIPYVW